ncbi:UDP-glucuronosyltransferase 2B18 [Culex quinquefasciatus]|uniref:UDP-glucuronosyltransferase 2B18 n=1 Tax=Culex quinquefasciatus TaxID=7176 RepID=B0WDI2_CULQU|nr:UDP-glucuronosyltransferase 2B18 [Culex quinquefasciatus]|eukprot:XP_001846766.1 UDP-glucuronosyltransferase 2B18 [Culex quinquefasciatus]
MSTSGKSLSAVIVLLVLVAVPLISADNILFLQSLASKSHHIWNKQIFERLYDNGHNLTILSFEEEPSVPGKTFLMVRGLMDKVMQEYGGAEWDVTVEQSAIVNVFFLYDFYERASRHLAQEEAIHRLLAYPRSFKFDLIIHDFTMGHFLLGFVDYFGNPPLVSVTAFNIPSHTPDLSDAPVHPSYMPHYASSFGSQMNFVERAKNTLYWTLDHVCRNYIYMTSEDRRVKQLFGPDAPSVKDVEKRSDIILVNGHFSMDYYQLLPPNVISVAGLHVSRSEEVAPIVKQFIARANKGAVLFSFGTNIQSEMLGPDVNKQILAAFRSMPEYGFIWKHGDPLSLGVVPPNVLVLKWVPQSAILANPRTKLFISHGGLLSTQEATWHGVPVVAVPFFVDQYANADKLVRAGVATKLLPKDVNEKTLKEAILRVVEDPSCRSKMKERSYHFKGQPDHPLDRAIFWIEKVLENKGLAYLRSPALEMSAIQVYNLDLLGAVALAAFLFYVLLGKILGCFIPKTNKRKTKSKTT